MADVADMSDFFVTAEVGSGVEVSRLRLLKRELDPNGRCHYCTEPVDPNRVYCDGECAAADAYEKKRREELGR